MQGFSQKFPSRFVIGLLSVSALLWILLITLYTTAQKEPTEIATRLRYADRRMTEASGSAQSSGSAALNNPPIPTLPPPAPTPTSPPVGQPINNPQLPSNPTPTPALQSGPKTQNTGPSSSKSSSQNPASSGTKNSPVPTRRFGGSTLRIGGLLTPTPAPALSRMRLAFAFPDVSPSIKKIERVKIVFYRQVGAGKWVRLFESKGEVVVERVKDTVYFESSEPFEINIRSLVSARTAKEIRTYGLFVKAPHTLGRFFTGIVLRELKKGARPFIIECAVSARPSKDCGELVTLRDLKPLLSGDSDGFLDGSASYNVVDIRDLDYLASRFRRTVEKGGERWADFDLDGVVNQFDLAVLTKNYGITGDRIDE